MTNVVPGPVWRGKVTPGEPMPFESSFFDVVVANQVFEHIPELDQVRDELARIIRPGGILLALMPTSEVLWENHLKMPWVHRLPLGSERQRTFMKACRRFGFGTNRHVADDDWVNGVVDDLRHNIFHRPAAEYITVFGKKFRLVDEAEPAWARYRINRHRLLKHGSGIFDRGFLDGLIRQIVRRSAGAVLVLERM